jgi:signal transduction histidine kinase
MTGAPRPLPSTVDVTAYRIVQEALTNVVRHAGSGSKATISIDFSDDAVELGISDTGSPDGLPTLQSSTGSRLGLIGMRERVASVGGELTTGPRPAGGFEVRARLPIGEAG